MSGTGQGTRTGSRAGFVAFVVVAIVVAALTSSYWKGPTTDKCMQLSCDNPKVLVVSGQTNQDDMLIDIWISGDAIITPDYHIHDHSGGKQWRHDFLLNPSRTGHITVILSIPAQTHSNHVECDIRYKLSGQALSSEKGVYSAPDERYLAHCEARVNG